MRLDYTLNPRKIALVLGFLALYFAVQSLLTEYLIYNVLDENADSVLIIVLDLFSVNVEESLPTWYATLLLFGAAGLLAFITAAKFATQDAAAWRWAGLALVFVYLSMDEGAAIHEVVADVVQTRLTLTGYLFFAWQVVAAPLVILFVILYWRFLFRLPPRTRHLFILAGVVYIGGALVVEGISANRYYLDGGLTFAYLVIATIEELSEMLGVVLFIYALLDYSVRMRYGVALMPPVTDGVMVQSNDVVHADGPRWRPRRVIILAVLGVLMVNAVLIALAVTQTARHTTALNQAIMDQLRAYDVQVTPLEGHFSPDNLPAREAAAALLAEFDDVMIVTWAATDASIALAAAELPFDRNALSQMLTENGVTQFVIFDTPAVQALVGNVEG
jgi:hypothetical protein